VDRYIVPKRRYGKARLKRDGTCAETRFGLSAKRTSPFKLAAVSVQSTAGSRVVHINGSNAGYTMFCGRVETESGGTRRRTGGEVKGKEANGVGSQAVFSLTRNSPSSVNYNRSRPTRTPRKPVLD